MADASSWDKNTPAGTLPLRDADDLFRSDKSILQAALEQEHYFTDASGTSAGEHKLGSARIYSGASSAVSASGRSGALMWDETNSQLVAVHVATTTRIPTLAAANTWAGAQTFSAAVTCSSTLAVTGDFAINTNKFTVAASTGNVAAAGTLSAAGDFAIATSKFTVAASTGNTAVAGTLAVTGAATLSSTLAVTGDATWNGNHTHQVGTGGSRTVTFRNTAANDGAGRDTAQILFDGDGISNEWGAIGFLTTQAGALTERARITSAGVLAVGTTVVTGASVGDIVVTSSRGLVCTTPDGTKRYRITVDNSGSIASTLL